MQNDFSHLEPDYEDSSEDILASFPSLRSKTFETLYGCGDDEEGGVPLRRRDKSPKGSVDEPIQELVDLINSHPSFTTLSSCSGRIALFDPLLARTSSSTPATAPVVTASDKQQEQQHQSDRPMTDSTEEDERNIDSRSSATIRSGKGGTGGWLLAAHHVVEPAILVDLLDDNQHSETAATTSNNDQQDGDDDDNNVLSFKMEPLLLHVAAANLTRGRQLLQVALQAAGLRESGLVVTESRVTVALRGQSLALCVPLARRKDSPLRPNDEYLVALAQEANRRLQRNFEKIQRLFRAVQSQIFRPKSSSLAMGQDHDGRHGTTSAPAPATTCRIRASSTLPALNLWRHASVMVPSNTNSTDDNEDFEMDLLVFGGYGRDPSTTINDDVNSSTTAPTRRSDKVYRLRRNAEGSWSEAWEEVELGSDLQKDGDNASSDPMDACKENSLGLKVRKVVFTAREGLAACFVSCSLSSPSSCNNMIAIFGGRQGPNRPLNDLLFFDNNSFQTPMDVRGSVPAARWGHSFTAVSSSSPESNNAGISADSSSADDRPLALIVGGRTDTQTFDSVHVLSIVVVQEKEADESSAATTTSHLVWSEVVTQTVNPSCPRFYHAATMGTSHNQTFVFGGLENAQHLSGTTDKDQPSTSGLVVDTTTSCSPTGYKVDPLPGSPLDDFFGHSVSLLPFDLQSQHQATEDEAVLDSYTFLSIGGISREADEGADHDEECSPFRCVTLRPSIAETIACNRDTSKKDRRQQQQSKWVVQEHAVHYSADNDDNEIDLGCVVHHSCAVAPTRNPNEFQVLVVGGGVQGFAFGPIFAKSHLLTVRLLRTSKQESIINGQPELLSTGSTAAVNIEKMRNGSIQHHRATNTKTTVPPPKNSKEQRETNVVYVSKQDAKTAKTLLEEARLLDKEYRMTPAVSKNDNDDNAVPRQQQRETTCIAVPVTSECLALLENNTQQPYPSSNPLLVDSLQSLVQGIGRQEMPYSTAVFAAAPKKKKKAANS